jgi:hypothetical protein
MGVNMATANTQQDRNESGFNTPLVVLGTLAVLIAVYALSLFLQGGFLKAQEKEKQFKILEAPADETVTAATAEQQDLLNGGVRWIDKDKGTVGMSIDDAKAALVNKGMTE